MLRGLMHTKSAAAWPAAASMALFIAPMPGFFPQFTGNT
jgi:hypothetical protein